MAEYEVMEPLSGRVYYARPRKTEITRAVDLPPTGRGYLAGESPDGLVTLEGTPTAAEIRVLYRPGGGELGDGVVVQTIGSAPDGTWVAWGLNPALRYDVVARKAGRNDVIVSNVAPIPYDEITVDGDFLLDGSGNALAGDIEVYGGIPPYTVSVVVGKGAPPPGIAFSVVSHQLIGEGTSTAAGSYTWTLLIGASNGAQVEREFSIENIGT